MRTARLHRLAWGFGVLLLASITLAVASEERQPDGGGAFETLATDQMPEDQWNRILDRLRVNRLKLVAEGKLPAHPPRGARPELRFPLRAADHLDVDGFYGISGFVDQDSACPGHLLDYNCGQRTYDTSACYNHQGVDYLIWPFAFLWMELDGVEIVAAADGTILDKDDGFFDRNCNWVSSPNWNAVYVEHVDGSVAWYGHMKNGSTTPKPVGANVAAGEYLGIVGSSGVSTWPHLHFELFDSLGNLQEPHWVPLGCNTMNGFSWWAEQRPYREPGVNLVTVGDAAPFVSSCPNTENPNIEVNFEPGETIYTTTYYRDQLNGMQTQYSILRPDGSAWRQWSQTSSSDDTLSWWWWNWSIGAAEPLGVWRFRATFNGAIHETPFRLGGPDPAGSVDSLAIGKQAGTGELVLEWQPGCLAQDADYAVFEGQIGDFSNHAQVVCSTGGATSYVHAPAHPASYYLVVAQNAVSEGSYGTDGAGDERPQGTPPCKVREAGLCPP